MTNLFYYNSLILPVLDNIFKFNLTYLAKNYL